MNDAIRAVKNKAIIKSYFILFCTICLFLITYFLVTNLQSIILAASEGGRSIQCGVLEGETSRVYGPGEQALQLTPLSFQCFLYRCVYLLHRTECGSGNFIGVLSIKICLIYLIY